MYISPTIQKLVLAFCVVAALFFANFANAKVLTGGNPTCPCPGIRGPANTCPNVQQTLIVTDPPAGSIITFSVSNVPGNTGHIVSQSGATATIDQPGTFTAQVCFPLTITVPQGPNCGGGNVCTPPISATLSSSVSGNPSTVTICQTGPASIVLTCSANTAVNAATTTYRFFLNNVLFRDNATPTLTVDLNTFSGSLAAFSCQVVTQSNQCVSSFSNVISVVKCSGGGGNCPSTVTLTSLDNCPFRLQATINNPQVNTIYTFTLRRQDVMGGETVLGIQVIGPFGTIPAGGVFAIFSNLPAGAAGFVVDVNIPNCPTLTSNRVNLPDCGSICAPVGATLLASQPGNVATVCNTGSASSVLLTCFATSAVPIGTTFRFTKDGMVVAESTSNTLSVSFSDLSSTPSKFSCQVITACAGPASNVITVQRCVGVGNCPVTPSVTLVAVGNQCPFKLQAIINNPQINTVYTITLFVQTTMDGPRVAIETQTIGPFTTIPAGGVSVLFSNLPASGGWFEVDVSVPGCPIVTSNMSDIPPCPSGGNNCPTTVRLVSQGGCPFSLLATIDNPQTGVTYTFTLRRSTSASGPFTPIATQTVGPLTTIPSGGISALFSGLPAGNAFFIVDVSVANCPTISSNVVNLPDCGGVCPVTPSVTLVAVGNQCPFKLQAIINNPQINTVYTITLFVQTTMDGPRVAVETQTIGPFTTIPAGGVSVLFSNLPASGGWFEVDVSVPGCPIVTSNMSDIPPCPNNCPTPTLTRVSGDLCNQNLVLSATITGCTNGLNYLLTLERQPLTLNAFVPVASQSVPCVNGQATATFSGLSQAGTYRVRNELTNGGCTASLSNTLVFNTQTTLATGTVSISVSGVVCANPAQSATVTCDVIPAGSIVGPVTFVFFQADVNGNFDFTNPIPATSGNQLVISNVANANRLYKCQAQVDANCAIISTNSVLVQACTGGGGNCPTPTLTVKSGDLCSGTLKLLSTIVGCTNGVSYTFTLQSSSAAGGPFTNAGQSVTVVCNNGVASAIFSGISQAAFYRVQLTSTACVTTFSATLNVPQQTTLPTGSSLTLSVSGQICQTPSQAATLTCNIVPPTAIVGTVVYQFFVEGSTIPIAPTAGNTLVLTQNSQGNVNYFCTASVDNSCVITSNLVFVTVCAGGGNCPTTAPTLTASQTSVCFPFTCSTLTCTGTVPAGSILVIRIVGGATVQQGTSGQSTISRLVCPSQNTAYQCAIQTTGCTEVVSTTVTVQVTDASAAVCGNNNNRITLCHRTTSNTNPYNLLCLAVPGLLNGHCPQHQQDFVPVTGTCPTTPTTPSGPCSCVALGNAILAGDVNPQFS